MRTAFATSEPGGQGVLVCALERYVVRLVQVNFERKGYFVVPAFDGLDALKALESADLPFERVVLDSQLLDMEGYSVLRRIRENDRAKRARVTLLYRKPEELDELRQREHRADAYLQIPFNPMELFR